MTHKALQDSQPVDPRTQGPRPDYSQSAIEPPGLEAEMTPRADHGERSYRGLGRLTDRVALITGGDSGIGRAVAIAYAREGAHVAISYLPEEEADAQEKWTAGRRSRPAAGDVGSCRSARVEGGRNGQCTRAVLSPR